MKTNVLLAAVIAILFTASPSAAQRTVKGLLDAERAFAAYTEKNNIRDGFLKYMDSAGVIFQQGKPVNAVAFFTKQKAGPAVLSWEPAFAVISASGDLGVTTGPFLVRARSIADTPVGRGNFSSIWKINAAGEWKNLVDLGVEYKKSAPPIQQANEIAMVKNALPPQTFATILDIDAKFNQEIRNKSLAALLPQIAPDSWLNAEGETPIRGSQLIGNLLVHIPDTVYFTPITGAIAASNDLAYVYGSVMNGNKKENYLRVWANRNKRWQVILQTIKW